MNWYLGYVIPIMSYELIMRHVLIVTPQKFGIFLKLLNCLQKWSSNGHLQNKYQKHVFVWVLTITISNFIVRGLAFVERSL